MGKVLRTPEKKAQEVRHFGFKFEVAILSTSFDDELVPGIWSECSQIGSVQTKLYLFIWSYEVVNLWKFGNFIHGETHPTTLHVRLT